MASETKEIQRWCISEQVGVSSMQDSADRKTDRTELQRAKLFRYEKYDKMF